MVELDHELAPISERRGQAGTVAAGRLDRPGAAFVDGESLRPSEGMTISSSRRGERRRRQLALRGDAYDGRGDAVTVWIHADHMVDEFCKDSHFVCLLLFDEIHRRKGIEAGL